MSAPRMPRMEPKAAPIKRFRLAFSNRTSKKMKKIPRAKPKIADLVTEKPKGCKCIAAAVRMITKMIRTAPISQNMRPDLLLEPHVASRHDTTGPLFDCDITRGVYHPLGRRKSQVK